MKETETLNDQAFDVETFCWLIRLRSRPASSVTFLPETFAPMKDMSCPATNVASRPAVTCALEKSVASAAERLASAPTDQPSFCTPSVTPMRMSVCVSCRQRRRRPMLLPAISVVSRPANHPICYQALHFKCETAMLSLESISSSLESKITCYNIHFKPATIPVNRFYSIRRIGHNADSSHGIAIR